MAAIVAILSFTAMPSYFPEGNAPHPQDSVERSLQKINSELYDTLASFTSMPTFFPEGGIPHPQDDIRRSLQKINGLVNGLSAAVSASAVYLAADVAAVRALTTRYSIVRIPTLGWDFNWVSTSTTADDGATVLCPDDITHPAPGRYERFI